MSSGRKFPLAEAELIAHAWLARFQPLCARAEIAGSIRRRKPEVGDIEICILPEPAGMYQLVTLLNRPDRAMAIHRDELRQLRARKETAEAKIKARLQELAAERGEPLRVKGEYPGRYVQLVLPEGLALDMFICLPTTWALNFFVRTGSVEFSAAMAERSKSLGYVWHEALVYRRDPESGDPTGASIQLREEKDVFELFKINWVAPERRSDGAALKRAIAGP